MGDLPGILPPDAGRAERAARDYAIAVLSRHCVLRSAGAKEGRAIGALEECCGVLDLVRVTMDDVRDFGFYGEVVYTEPPRILRARVALYLRWCRRVERRWSTAPPIVRNHRFASWWASGSRIIAGPDGEPTVAWVWAVPLWTLAPAHGPAVGPRERRNRKRPATMDAP